jgi:hypothetical protein
VKYEQEAPDCTWKTHKFMKRNLEIQTRSFLFALKDLNLNLI